MRQVHWSGPCEERQKEAESRWECSGHVPNLGSFSQHKWSPRAEDGSHGALLWLEMAWLGAPTMFSQCLGLPGKLVALA